MSTRLVLETTGDCWPLGLTPSLPPPMGKISETENSHKVSFYIFLCNFVPLFSLLYSYKPVGTYATVSKDGAEVVDFRLTPLHSDPSGQSPKVPQPTLNPSEKAFQSLIKELSLGQGLEQLVRSTATENSFRYRRYKELSGFLRGLTLNFPKMTSLRRWASYLYTSHPRVSQCCVS